MYSDSSLNPNLGCGGVCMTSWFVLQWDADFILQKKPSIAYLELYAVTINVLSYLHLFEGKNISLFCDNMAVVEMINNKTSSCRNCMVLIRMVVLKSMIHNVKVSARHVTTKANMISDSLSRLDFDRFRRLSGDKYQDEPSDIPSELWPMTKIWLD